MGGLNKDGHGPPHPPPLTVRAQCTCQWDSSQEGPLDSVAFKAFQLSGPGSLQPDSQESPDSTRHRPRQATQPCRPHALHPAHTCTHTCTHSLTNAQTHAKIAGTQDKGPHLGSGHLLLSLQSLNQQILNGVQILPHSASADSQCCSRPCRSFTAQGSTFVITTIRASWSHKHWVRTLSGALGERFKRIRGKVGKGRLDYIQTAHSDAL